MAIPIFTKPQEIYSPVDMNESQREPKEPRISFDIKAWFQQERGYEAGYWSDVRLHDSKVFFNSWKQVTNKTKEYSDSFYCKPYTRMLVLFDLAAEVGTHPAGNYIRVDLEYSWDNVTWFKYDRDAWGDMRWVPATAPAKECFDADVIAPYVRFATYTSGGDSSTYFPISLTAVFVSGA